MPIFPTPEENFIRGLSDFWTRFFADTAQIEAFYDAAQSQLGQLYLELLQDTLGTSLAHAPLFSKKYFQLLTIREDQLRFVEGNSAATDRYVFRPAAALVAAAHLTNKVALPTAVLDQRRDYDLADGELRFAQDLFNAGADDVTVAGFPVRRVPTRVSVTLVDPRGGTWRTRGVRAGDRARFTFLRGPAVEREVTGMRGAALFLDRDEETLHLDLVDHIASRRWTYDVFRRPYDAAQRHQPMPAYQVATTPVIVHAVLDTSHVRVMANGVIGTNPVITSGTTVTVDNADPAWVGRSLAISDSGQPINNGVFTILAVFGTTVVLGGGLSPVGTGVVAVTMGDDSDPAWVGQYYLLADPDHAANTGFVKITAHSGFSDAVASTTLAVTTRQIRGWRVQFTDDTPTTPTYALPHTFIVPGSVSIEGTRGADRTVDGVTYPAGFPVREGVDYIVDYDGGRIAFTWVWDPLQVPTISYEWRLRVDHQTFVYYDAWSALATYVEGEIVIHGGARWTAKTTSPTTGTFVPTEWQPLTAPFVFGASYDLRELAFWAPDVLIDEDRLYTNFGYLLSFKRPSSEAYRTFLRGVAQLFLLGPSLERIESALNVTAGLPVVRDDGEVFRSFDTGYEILGGSGLLARSGDVRLGVRGEVTDRRYGINGVLAAAGTFTIDDPAYLGAWSSTRTYARNDVVLQLGRRWRADVAVPTVGTFVPDEWLPLLPFFVLGTDVGTVITTRTDGSFAVYTVTAIDATGFVATVLPAPPTDATGVAYDYAHNGVTRQFTIDSADVDFRFAPSDVDAVVTVVSPREARNRGTFRILAVVNAKTVVLDSEFPLIDEEGLVFRVSRTLAQTVTTSRATYAAPLGVPLKAELLDPASVDTLTFAAFATLTDAVRVVDYIVDPTWWHSITIPKEILQLDVESEERRQVSPLLIRHIADALDRAAVSDFGIFAGADDEGVPGLARAGTVTWLGADWVTITLPPEAPLATPMDVGEHLHVEPGSPFAGDFRIREVRDDGVTFRLDAFPPPPARRLVAPQAFSGALPPVLYRRTVAFVMMDRFLKYHALKIEITLGGITVPTFTTDAVALLTAAKPSYTFLYLEPDTRFADTMHFVETFGLAFGPYINYLLQTIDNTLRASTAVHADEYFSYLSGTTTLVWGGGVPGPQTVTGTFAYAVDRQLLLHLRITGTTGGRPLVEGLDYTVDWTTRVVTFTASVDAASVAFDYLVVGLRGKDPTPSPWWTGQAASVVGPIWYAETPVAFAGPDPLVRVNDGMTPDDQGIVDRALQIGIS